MRTTPAPAPRPVGARLAWLHSSNPGFRPQSAGEHREAGCGRYHAANEELTQASGGIILDHTGNEARFKCTQCGRVWRESELRPRLLYCTCGSSSYTRYYG